MALDLIEGGRIQQGVTKVITEPRASGLLEAQIVPQGVQLGLADCIVGPFAESPNSFYETNPDVLAKTTKLNVDAGKTEPPLFTHVLVSAGSTEAGGLKLDDPDLKRAYRRGAKATGIEVSGVCLDKFGNQKPFSSDTKEQTRAQQHIRDGIEAARAIGAKSLRVPLFSADTMLTAERFDKAVGIFGEMAEEAGKGGVVLGLEETLPVGGLKDEEKGKIDLIEAIGSDNAGIDLDTGNEFKNGRDTAEVSARLARAGVINIVDLKINSTRKTETKNPQVIPLRLDDISRYDIREPLGSLVRNGYRGAYYLEAITPEDYFNQEADFTVRQARVDEGNISNGNHVTNILIAELKAA